MECRRVPRLWLWVDPTLRWQLLTEGIHTCAYNLSGGSKQTRPEAPLIHSEGPIWLWNCSVLTFKDGETPLSTAAASFLRYQHSQSNVGRNRVAKQSVKLPLFASLSWLDEASPESQKRRKRHKLITREITQTVHALTCHISEQRGWEVTKPDKYFISKYDFGIPSLLSDKPLGKSRELE